MKRPLRIALYCVLLISIAAVTVLVVGIARQSKLPPISIVTESGIDISGEWYGGPENRDVLTFYKDGRYESSSWITSGTFCVEGETIQMVDPYGAKKEFALKEGHLSYSDGGMTYDYVRTKQQLPPEMPEGEGLDYMYLTTVNQILQKGKWEAANNIGLTITDKTIASGGCKAAPYSITKITAQNGEYQVSIKINKEDHALTIREASDGYHLTIQPFSSAEFIAPANFSLEQP